MIKWETMKLQRTYNLWEGSLKNSYTSRKLHLDLKGKCPKCSEEVPSRIVQLRCYDSILFNYTVIEIYSMYMCLSNKLFYCLSIIYVINITNRHAENTCNKNFKKVLFVYKHMGILSIYVLIRGILNTLIHTERT